MPSSIYLRRRYLIYRALQKLTSTRPLPPPHCPIPSLVRAGGQQVLYTQAPARPVCTRPHPPNSLRPLAARQSSPHSDTPTSHTHTTPLAQHPVCPAHLHLFDLVPHQ